MSPRVAIIYLAYHADAYLPDVVAALERMTYPKDRVELVIVENPHPEFGLSRAFIESTIMPLSGKAIPQVTYLPQEKNLGFSAGNNVGMQWAIDHGCDYVLLHNDDGYLAPEAVATLVGAMEHDATIGEAQALVMLHPETDRVNTSGNCFQFLGFGYGNDYRVRLSEAHFAPIEEISYASGAAVMLRVPLLRDCGLWEEAFFMYHEDTEYSFRLRQHGYRIVRVTAALFFHKYEFRRSIQKFYLMERNRFALLLMMYRAGTLVLLLPLLIALEIGLWFFAWRGGWLSERIAVFRYWSQAEHWRLWLAKRRQFQSVRCLTDRELLRYIVPTISFQDASVDQPIITYLGNPVMVVYYWIIRTIIFW